MNVYQGSWDMIKEGTSAVIKEPVHVATTLLSYLFVSLATLLGAIVIVLMVATAAQAEEFNMQCEQYGYADSAEKFHSIVTEPTTERFAVSEHSVYSGASGWTYTAIDPASVGFDKDVATYKNEDSHEVLYIYMVDGKPEIGVSLLVPDSDVFFEEKQLFTSCGPVPAKQQVTGSVIRTQLAGVPIDRRAVTF